MDTDEVAPQDNLLQVVYDHGPVKGFKWDDFETVRKRIHGQWPSTPKTADNISASLKRKITEQMRLRGKIVTL